MDLAGWLNRCPIVAILRGIRPSEVESICSVLESEGIFIVEVPLNSPNALESISILSRVFGNRMLIGAGTVTDPEQIAEVAAVGGRLIVTPHADCDIVRTAKAAGQFVAAGCLSPTEAFAVLAAGADVIKLFPSEVGGVSMMKALKAVLPKTVAIIPVGGVDATNVRSWMAAGATGIGIGSSLYRPGDEAQAVRSKVKALIVKLQSHSCAEAEILN